jgi:hypothetical protein
VTIRAKLVAAIALTVIGPLVTIAVALSARETEALLARARSAPGS